MGNDAAGQVSLRLGRRLLVHHRDGTWGLRLSAAERELLGSLAEQLAGLLGQEPDNPTLHRLFPPAYPDDVANEAEWQVFRAAELRSSREAHLAVLRSLSSQTALNDDQVQAWMQAINALRLVVGTQLDITDDDQQLVVASDDPRLPVFQLYEFLSYLLDATITALSR